LQLLVQHEADEV